MTLTEFGPIFSALALQLQSANADETTLRSYFASLKDLDVALVALAARRLDRTGAFFPKTSEWRAEVAKIDRERTDAQRALLRKLPSPLCLACTDTGWAVGEHGVHRCECLRLRRLEVLGRRPWPALPSAVLERPTS